MKVYVGDSTGVRVLESGKPDHYIPSDHDAVLTMLGDVLTPDAAVAVAPLVERRLKKFFNAVRGCGTWAITEKTLAALVAEVLLEAKQMVEPEKVRIDA